MNNDIKSLTHEELLVKYERLKWECDEHNRCATNYWHQVTVLQKELDVFHDLLNDARKYHLSVMINNYHKLYDNKNDWDMCCSGFECGCRGWPIDPEYYIYRDLMEIEELLKQLEILDK